MVVSVNYKKNSYLNNYSKKLLCQANCFNFQSNQDSFFVRLLAWYVKLQKHKALKKELSEGLMPISWHHKRYWIFCVSEDEKKEIELIFAEGL